MTESLQNINRVIIDNRSTLDSIQDMAVELTRAVQTLEQAAVKYIRMVDGVLEQLIPIMKSIPLVPKGVVVMATNIEATTTKFLAACDMAERVLPGVEAGLTTADMTKLKASTGDVQKLTITLQSLLAGMDKK
ncbi:MAG: hypothetical protein HPY76_13390 [Anaerolineae bacterium]|nr:hypothetical protein [Anaerolineae bacterium]